MNPVEEFCSIVGLPDEQIDLARAALVMGSAHHPDMDSARGRTTLDACIAQLDEFAYGVDDLTSLRRRLFEELGFSGDTEHYYEPENSFLDSVMERKRGIPITLSVLTIEVGRRAGISLDAIGMPGHFLVRSSLTGEYIDPFFGGEILDEEGCEQRFRQVTGVKGSVAFAPGMRPVSNKLETLARMLNNLKAIYRARGDGRNLEWVLRLRLAIPIVPREEVAGLGEALALQGRFLEGAVEIEAVLAKHPELAPTLTAASRSLRASLN